MKRLILSIVSSIMILSFSGCSNGGAMEFSKDNLIEFNKLSTEVADSISPNTKKVDAMKILYVDTLDDMGYSLDETLLEYIKFLSNDDIKNRSPYVSAIEKIFAPAERYIVSHPKLAVEEDIVEQETVDKLLHYQKFSSLDQNSIEAIKFVAECQDAHDGICTVKEYLQILLDNKFAQKFISNTEYANSKDHIKAWNQYTVNNFWDKKYDTIDRRTYISLFQYVHFDKYVLDTDNNPVQAYYMFDNKNTKIKLSKNALKDIEEYDPWWID